MGKKTRIALMGFAAGALKGVSDFYQTKAAQEAELVREQRLAQIRAEERGQDREFQREMSREQMAAQEDRDIRLAEQQAERDKTRDAQAITIMDRELAARRDIASMPARSAPRMIQLEVPDGKGGTMLRSVREDDPILQQGVPGARLATQGAQYMNAETRAAEAAAESAPAAAPARPGGGGGEKVPEGSRRLVDFQNMTYEVFRGGKWVRE